MTEIKIQNWKKTTFFVSCKLIVVYQFPKFQSKERYLHRAKIRVESGEEDLSCSGVAEHTAKDDVDVLVQLEPDVVHLGGAVHQLAFFLDLKNDINKC